MTESERIAEIDVGRVVAIGLMIAYHTAYDLGVFYRQSIDVYHGAWRVIGKVSPVLFLLLVGISFTLSWERTAVASRYIRKGGRVFLYGVFVSLVTFVFDSQTFVRFGILHLIGLSMMLLPFVPRSPSRGLLLIFMCIGMGLAVDPLQIRNSLLLPIGVRYAGFRSVDYYPIFPWIGIIILGVVIGNQYIALGRPTLLKLPPPIKCTVEAISKKSLLIYMLHQPVLLLVLRMTLGSVE